MRNRLMGWLGSNRFAIGLPLIFGAGVAYSHPANYWAPIQLAMSCLIMNNNTPSCATYDECEATPEVGPPLLTDIYCSPELYDHECASSPERWCKDAKISNPNIRCGNKLRCYDRTPILDDQMDPVPCGNTRSFCESGLVV